jgi:cell division protein FtsL
VRTAVRFGLLYLLALLLLFALGHRNQMEKAALARMEARLAELQKEEEALLQEAWRASRPLRVLEWAKKEGFVPMSQGRWAP